MEMFNQRSIKERIGDTIKKSETLHHLKDCEKYFLKLARKYKIEHAYDVVANELTYFKTIQYTEWAHCFAMNPLSQELRVKQMEDARYNEVDKYDFLGYFRDKVKSKTSNKYQDIKSKPLEQRDHLIVPVGSNKLKDTICLNKLCFLRDKYDGNIWFKPHPLTTHALIGELRDILGDMVLDRSHDVYALLESAETVHTSHMSETCVYAVAMGKDIDMIDIMNKVHEGSFYHINRMMFLSSDPAATIQSCLNGVECGIVNPEIQDDWQQRMDQYFEYIFEEREKRKYHYVSTIKGYDY